MATLLESTTPRPLPTFQREIRYDPVTRDYAMILDGQCVGNARTYHDAELTLDDLVLEILALYAAAPTCPLSPTDTAIALPSAQPPAPAHTLPLPSPEAIGEVLDETAVLYGDDRTAVYRQAREALQAGVAVRTDGAVTQVGMMLVRPARARAGWPWRCDCGLARCWHAALAEAVVVARERQADAQDTGDPCVPLAA